MAIIHGKTVEMETVKLVEDSKAKIQQELKALEKNPLGASKFKLEVGNYGVDNQFIQNVNNLGGPVQPDSTPNKTEGNNRGRQ